jgi:NDP-sugar pyrophosphorylase family protein
MKRAVILAGGKGARLAPYSTVLPKPLMPINNMPILEVVIRQLKFYGFTKLTIAVGHLSELIEAFFGDGKKWGVKIDYSREDKPLGTAGPLSLVKNLKTPFLVMNGDLLTTLSYSDFMSRHNKSKAVATLGVFQRAVKIDLGIIKSDSKNIIREYIEKPSLEYDVSSGIYAFNPSVLKYIPRNRRLDLPDLVRNLIANKETVMAYKFKGYWLDIGRHDDYAQAAEEFGKNRRRFLR